MIKQMISKIPYGLIPMVVVGILIIIGSIITFLIYFKDPISLNDSKDSTAIISLIKDKHPGFKITDINLQSNISLPSNTFEIIYNKSHNVKTEDDIYYYVRSVNYNVVSDKDTVNYDLIFEISEKFLHEEVGQYLFIIDKTSGEIIE